MYEDYDIELMSRHSQNPDFLALCELWGVEPWNADFATTPKEMQDFMRGVGLKGRNGKIRGGMRRPQLSRADERLIRDDHELRANGKYISKCWPGPEKGNHYLDFLARCEDHAREVGDFKIADKLLNRRMVWQEQYQQEYDWSDVWSRKKPDESQTHQKALPQGPVPDPGESPESPEDVAEFRAQGNL